MSFMGKTFSSFSRRRARDGRALASSSTRRRNRKTLGISARQYKRKVRVHRRRHLK